MIQLLFRCCTLCYNDLLFLQCAETQCPRRVLPIISFALWQIGPNLSIGIRWCLALASVRPQWCLLWRFWCVCMCVCRVNGGPDLVCVMEACLICGICVNCGIWNLGIYQLLRISGACNVCPSCVLWLDPLGWCQFLSGVVNFLVIFVVFETVWIYQQAFVIQWWHKHRGSFHIIWDMLWIFVNDLMKLEHWQSQT